MQAKKKLTAVPHSNSQNRIKDGTGSGISCYLAEVAIWQLKVLL